MVLIKTYNARKLIQISSLATVGLLQAGLIYWITGNIFVSALSILTGVIKK